jgi:SAM-dependent methyltransferase
MLLPINLLWYRSPIRMVSLRQIAKKVLPEPVFNSMRPGYHMLLRQKYKYLGRSATVGETTTARPRRIGENFFENFCTGTGLDIGYGGDLLAPNCRGWDVEDGDAQYLDGLNDEQFDFVYSSHTLEHVPDVELSLRNWWRVLKTGGYLIVYIPHRDLYEKKPTLPSRWNADHKHFFLPDRDEAPDTIGVRPLLARVIPEGEVVYVNECSEGHTITDPLIHSNGEYSIEFVVKKLSRRSI